MENQSSPSPTFIFKTFLIQTSTGVLAVLDGRLEHLCPHRSPDCLMNRKKSSGSHPAADVIIKLKTSEVDQD